MKYSEYRKITEKDNIYIPCYLYVENKGLSYYQNFMNCYIEVICNVDNNFLINGNNFWILRPFIKNNMCIDSIIELGKNTEEIIWVVDFTSKKTDNNKLWNFNKNIPYKSYLIK